MPVDVVPEIRSREAQRLATRERLFTAAVEEFKRSGVAAAEVRAIVAGADVAHGTFFFHFPTKEHVLAELGQREEARMCAELERFLGQPRSLEETLTEVVRRTMSMERRLGRSLFRELLALCFSASSPALAQWQDHPFMTRVLVELERARARGEIVDDAVDPASSSLFFFHGLYALLVTSERNATRSELLDQFVATTLRGLGSR